MSAAFTLEPFDLSQCGFPNCIGRAFHEGDHQFPAPKIETGRRARQYRCTECGNLMEIYGEAIPGSTHLCESQECLLAFCRRVISLQPLRCNCPQRPYAHDLSIHTKIRSEAYNPELRNKYPWSLALAERMEPSTERSAA